MKKMIRLMNKLILFGLFAFLALPAFGQAQKSTLKKPAEQKERVAIMTIATPTSSATAPSQQRQIQKDYKKVLIEEISSFDTNNERIEFLREKRNTTTNADEKAYIDKILLKYKSE